MILLSLLTYNGRIIEIPIYSVISIHYNFLYRFKIDIFNMSNPKFKFGISKIGKFMLPPMIYGPSMLKFLNLTVTLIVEK